MCAILLGQPTLTRVGILVAALPLITAATLGRSRYRLALVRSVGPQTVTAGQTSTVHLTMTNEGRTPSGVLMLEDHVPYVLGTGPRFVLDGIGHGWRRHAVYQVRSDVRGRFEIGPDERAGQRPLRPRRAGPLLPQHGDPDRHPAYRSPAADPTRWRLDRSGDNRPRAFAIGSAEDVTVRECPAVTTCAASTGATRRASAS